MKKLVSILSTALIAATVFSGAAVFASDSDFGSAGALSDDSYTLEEMLTYAIQDEYMAKAEYEAILDTYGSVRPFSNIVRSEETHISLLLPLFETYGLTVPENTAAENVVLPDTLAETYPIGVEAEINNIGMYESFLKEDLPADVEFVFTRLMDASENHLAAFQNAEDRQTGTGTFGNGTSSGFGRQNTGNRFGR
jgi:hypothetical protein